MSAVGTIACRNSIWQSWAFGSRQLGALSESLEVIVPVSLTKKLKVSPMCPNNCCLFAVTYNLFNNLAVSSKCSSVSESACDRDPFKKMQLTYAVMFVACLAAATAEQLLTRQTVFPRCLTQPSTYGSCLGTDTACLCESRAYISAVTACVDGACTAASDRLQAADASSSTCAIYGVNLSSVAAGATATAATTSTHGTTKTTMGLYPYSTPASPGIIKTSSNTVTVGGAVGGGAALLTIILIASLLRRRLRQRQYLVAPRLPAAQAPRYDPPQGDGRRGTMMGEEIKTSYSGTPGVGPDTFVPYGYQVPPVQKLRRQRQYRQDKNQKNVQSPHPMTAAAPPPPPPPPPRPAAFPAPSPAANMPVPLLQQPYRSYPSSQTANPTTEMPTLSSQQLEMMQRMQQLSPQQLDFVERMDAEIRVRSDGRVDEGGDSTTVVAGEAPPSYDFKTRD
ncbi:hypothetical protein FRB98_009007 [Tulasnella sp. 332]|nr:hypothetical protein FRB98_009007 [Tulasnella sp. 332]